MRAGWSDADRNAKRVQLRRILNAAVSAHSLQVYYYQGLHDVASVLLLVLGEGLAFQVLCHLVGNQLRDCTRWGWALRCMAWQAPAVGCTAGEPAGGLHAVRRVPASAVGRGALHGGHGREHSDVCTQ